MAGSSVLMPSSDGSSPPSTSLGLPCFGSFTVAFVSFPGPDSLALSSKVTLLLRLTARATRLLSDIVSALAVFGLVFGFAVCGGGAFGSAACSFPVDFAVFSLLDDEGDVFACCFG